KIGHVFLIVLENESYAKTFGDGSPAPYLAKTLVGQGARLDQYYGIGHNSLDNYIAMISGQAPNPATQEDCQNYTEFAYGGLGADGQALGRGCVYPASIKTLADQLAASGLSWKGYMEDLGAKSGRQTAACGGHPAIGAQDTTQHAATGDQYAMRHDPFAYFHSVLDTPDCTAHIVPLTALEADLADAARTPSFSFITPNLCHDGHDHKGPQQLCVGENSPGGLVAIDGFLKRWVPAIMGSPAFKADGLLVVTFDEAETPVEDSADSDSTSCCGEAADLNIHPGDAVFGVPDTGPGVNGPGGGRIGAVLLSPFILPGTVSEQPYNHYSLLRTIEDIFGLAPLGYAGPAHAFGADVFNRK
ncbi:MAG TPA: alkaline phosphatase family protein, partial [Stellaceae bacterium]|nr:alkaline phosphatase family protein [Stellaceae bacterium]